MIDEALTELIRPLVRQIVREEIRRAQTQRRYLPVKKAAEEMGISEAAARQRVRRGQLPGRNVEGRVYVDMESLDRVIAGSATVVGQRRKTPARNQPPGAWTQGGVTPDVSNSLRR
jgi:Helix-turn-helix domain